MRRSDSPRNLSSESLKTTIPTNHRSTSKSTLPKNVSRAVASMEQMERQVYESFLPRIVYNDPRGHVTEFIYLLQCSHKKCILVPQHSLSFGHSKACRDRV